MTMIRTLLLAAAFVLVPLSASAEDGSVADAKAAATAETKAAPAAEGKASARMLGTWSIVLPPEMLAELDAAKKAASENPDSSAARAGLQMIEQIVQLIGSTTMTIDGSKLTMTGPDPESGRSASDSASYRVLEDGPDAVRFEATDEKGEKDTIRLVFTGADRMTLTEEGDAQAPTIEFVRKK